MLENNFGHTESNQQSAISNQQSAISNQQSAISNQQSKILPVLHKVKGAYLTWYRFYQDIPKTHRYSLGQRIDTLFVDIIEAISAASFLSREEKHPYVRLAIKKLDALRVLLMILWEAKSFDSKKYITLSVMLDEVGKMLGGWNGQLTKRQKLSSPNCK